VPCSFREAEPVTPIANWISSQAEFKEVKDTLLPGHAAQIKSIPEFLKSLNENTLRIFKSRHEVDDEGWDRSPLGRSADGK
jgi:hypothetical protein